MSNKTPQPGEFWEKENVRLRVIGSKRNGVFVGEHECGSIALFVSHHDWRHLPDCTGFDWGPETFPQWYLFQGLQLFGSGSDRYAIRRNSKTQYEFIGLYTAEPCTDAWGESCDKAVSLGTWVKVTEEQASNALRPQPAESPDDWVTQDRVPARPGIDEGWFEYDYYRARYKKQFWSIASQPEHAGRRHGDRVDLSGDLATFELRCRRKDLPSLGPLGDQISWFKADAMPPLPNKFATLANEIEQLRADVMRRCDELGVRLTELEEGGK